MAGKRAPGKPIRRVAAPAPPNCPTPAKRRYATEQAARRRAQFWVERWTYQCRCGFFHVTKRPQDGSS
jgi:hypothetical protein